MKLGKRVARSIALASVLALAACSKAERTAEQTVMPEISKSTLELASTKRVVFAHQSVGRDLLNGVRELADHNGVAIRIVETRTPESGTGIFHFRVGKNRNPQGKITDFVNAFEQIGVQEPDIAIMKLCYIDFSRETNANALAREYVDAIKTLQAKYPNTRIVSMTSPLTTVETGPKAMLKKLLGKQPEGYVENALRQQFNDYLRKEFPPEQLFDIAALEANAANKEPLVVNGSPVQTLPEHLTYDGGHLTPEGNRMVAASFLAFIGRVPSTVGPANDT